ncbi:hypothetical protein AB685_03650 [Bacillus sp. LL01]|uniref:hypothetical protein n=1 Tax=Bacillus sp. LL01 TaxID=1665556 RepID=UPI00064D5F3A|nr:hypothetical protein [Bacillus sp. LL01]KMJ59954.1 hypothetical protein AB685_03650 [Bacillus sp. LL01]
MHDTYRGLTKILMGFIIALIDINIAYVNIIPDFIGYGMVAYGLMQLDSEKEKNWAVFLAIFSFPEFFIPNINVMEPLLYEGQFYLSSVYHTSLGVLHLYIMYLTISMLIRMAEGKGLFHIAKSASSRLKVYVIANISIFIATPFAINWGESLVFLLFFVIIFIFILEIIMLFLIARFRRVL